MQSKSNIKKSSAGRPSTMCREDILEAALNIGLDDLTMNGLAHHLNVGVSSIYYYFKNRKELIRAAAVFSFSNMPYPTDTGQHWTQLVFDYVTSIRDNLVLNSSFLYNNQMSEVGFDVHFRLLEPFLASMKQRGFSEEKSMKLMNSIGITAFGTAIETMRQNEFLNNNDTMKEAANRQFSRHDMGDYPHLKQALNIFTRSPEEKLEDLLRPILETFSQNKAEDEQKIDALFSPH